MSGWKDIATAPKDGTAVILGLFDEIEGITDLGACVMVGEWEHDDWRVSIGISAGPVVYLATILLPWTHWMPLPAPPGDGKPMPDAPEATP